MLQWKCEVGLRSKTLLKELNSTLSYNILLDKGHWRHLPNLVTFFTWSELRDEMCIAIMLQRAHSACSNHHVPFHLTTMEHVGGSPILAIGPDQLFVGIFLCADL